MGRMGEMGRMGRIGDVRSNDFSRFCLIGGGDRLLGFFESWVTLGG
jgi:hypothetical protein